MPGPGRPHSQRLPTITRLGIVLVLSGLLAGCDVLSGLTSPVLTPIAESLVGGPDLVIAGDFLVVDGQPRTGMVRMSPNGRVDGNFSVSVNGEISSVVAVAVGGEPRLYIGGDFTSVNGVAVTGLAAVDSRTGAFIPGFRPEIVNTAGVAGVAALLPVSERNSIIAGGLFNSVTGPTSQFIVTSLAEFDLQSGLADPGFSPELQPNGPATLVESLTAGYRETGGWTLVAGGLFTVGVAPNLFYGGAAFDRGGTLLAVIPPATNQNSRVPTVLRLQDDGLFGITGLVTNGSDDTHYAEVFFPDTIGATGYREFQPRQPETEELIVTDTNITAGNVRTSIKRADGGLILGGSDNIYVPFGSSIAIGVDAQGAADSGGYLIPAGTNPNPRVEVLLRNRDGAIYVGGSFDGVTDAFGVSGGGSIVRANDALEIDPSFSPTFSGALVAANPIVNDILQLPLGF